MPETEQQSRVRRRKGSGAIKGPRSGDGFYRGSKMIDGDRVYTSWHPTKQMVEEALRVLKPREKPQAGRTLQDAYNNWMGEAEIAATTKAGYDTSIRNYARPFLDVPVTEITREAVAAHYKKLRRQGYSQSTIRGAAAVIRGALKYAHDAGWIPFNPVVAIKLPDAPPADVDAITDEDRVLLLAALEGHRYEARYLLGLLHMLRPSEALGLRWSTVNLKAGTIHIAGQLQRVGRLVPGGTPLGTVYRHAAKSFQGMRKIWLDDRTLEAMKAWKKIQAAEAAAHTDTDFQITRRANQAKRLAAAKRAEELKMPDLYTVAPDDLVFTLRNGDPLLPRKDSDIWIELLESIDAQHNRRYAMRHSAVNRLLRDGAALDEVSAAAGHSSTRFTETRYGGERSERGKSLRNYM